MTRYQHEEMHMTINPTEPNLDDQEAKDLEEAQKDAAQERQDEGGYQ